MVLEQNKTLVNDEINKYNYNLRILLGTQYRRKRRVL